MDTKVLLDAILQSAKQQGVNQETLARLAHLSSENISRMKKRNNAEVGTLIRLADAAGLQLTLAPKAAPADQVPQTETNQPTFRQRYRHQAWSNKNVEEDVLIRKALLNPHFEQIVHAAKEYGIDKLRACWGDLLSQQPSEARAAQRDTERMLTNIERAISRVTKVQHDRFASA